jgi:hypothetical protein
MEKETQTRWQAALERVAQAARDKLPEHAATIEALMPLLARGAEVENGTAELYDADGTAVRVQKTCTECPTHPWCRHTLAYALARRTSESMMSPPPEAGPDEAGIPARFITKLRFKGGTAEHIQYEGLLWLAGQRRGGLQGISATFTQITKDFAVALATVTFHDGTVWTESGDATPENVGSEIKPHFPRMALTRAKARALRDALGIGTCSAEEL